MSVLKLKIDKVEYEIECKKGEENLLREVEVLINEQITNNPQFRSLPTSKMFLMIALTLAGDLNVLKKEYFIDGEVLKEKQEMVANQGKAK